MELMLNRRKLNVDKFDVMNYSKLDLYMRGYKHTAAAAQRRTCLEVSISDSITLFDVKK